MSTRAVDALLKRVRAIPDGEVAETARRAGLHHRHLTRLRQGQNADVQLSTLEKLSRGLGEPISALVGEQDWKPEPRQAGIDPRAVRRLLRRLDAVGAEARKVAGLLPNDSE